MKKLSADEKELVADYIIHLEDLRKGYSTCPLSDSNINTVMNKQFTYRQAFKTEQEALEFSYSIIGGGVIQKQNELWHVWQVNF